jgi:hypothetical protein
MVSSNTAPVVTSADDSKILPAYRRGRCSGGRVGVDEGSGGSATGWVGSATRSGYVAGRLQRHHQVAGEAAGITKIVIQPCTSD